MRQNISALLVAVVLLVSLAKCNRNEQSVNEAQMRLESYINQDRQYSFYIGVPLGDPAKWGIADVSDGAIKIEGETVLLHDVNSYLVTYANGDVLDAANVFTPLPEGVRFVEMKKDPRRDLLDTSVLAAGSRHVGITFGDSESHPGQPGHYSTLIQNISDSNIRVLQFGAYAKTADGYRLHTISGDLFTGEEFVQWYAAPRDGWIKPGQVVSDPNNYGGGDTYWVYYCERENGDEFVARAQTKQ